MFRKLAKVLPTFSLLFGVYPVFSLLATNRFELHDMEPFLIVRPLIMSILLVLIVYAIFWPLMQTSIAGEFSTLIFLILFYSYGHVENLLSLRDIPTGFLYPLWIIMLGLGLLMTVKYKDNISSLKNLLIIFTTVLVLFPTYKLASFSFQSINSKEINGTKITQIEDIVSPGESEYLEKTEKFITSENIPPFDIFYIVLDGYGRADVLADVYQYDNQSFIDQLRARGFYVAEKSNSNYSQTRLSIPSTLNMEYMQTLGFSSNTSFDLTEHHNLLTNSKVFKIFSEEENFHLVNYRSGYVVVDIQTLDYFMQFDGDEGVHLSDLPIIEIFGRPIALNNFEILFLQTTIFKPFVKDLVQSMDESPLYQDHRDRILYIFESLPTFASADGDYLIYAHIPAPHAPFVFFEDGTNRENFLPFDMSDGSHYLAKFGNREEYISRYIAQLSYINQLVLKTVNEILEASENPPIIIIQSDHGPGAYFDNESLKNTNLTERFGILNAYYFPDGNYQNLYPSISPVNSFRVIVNQYFGAGLDLLDDNSYFSTYENPYGFVEVTGELN